MLIKRSACLCFWLVRALCGCGCWRGRSPSLTLAPLSALWGSSSKKGCRCSQKWGTRRMSCFCPGLKPLHVFAWDIEPHAARNYGLTSNAERSAVPRLCCELVLALLHFARYQQKLIRVWQLNPLSLEWIQCKETSLLPHSGDSLSKGNTKHSGSLCKWFFTTAC